MWICWVTNQEINPDECYDCHDMSCRYNAGFTSGPKYVNNVLKEKNDKEKKISDSGKLCLATGKPMDASDCHNCHVMSCPVVTGFVESPEKG